LAGKTSASCLSLTTRDDTAKDCSFASGFVAGFFDCAKCSVDFSSKSTHDHPSASSGTWYHKSYTKPPYVDIDSDANLTPSTSAYTHKTGMESFPIQIFPF
jgi:hypothetical protein